MSGRTITEAAPGAGEPRYRPVFELETGRVVGAGLLRSDAAPPVDAIRRFADGAPALEDWWLAVDVRREAGAGLGLAADVRALLRSTGLQPDRLVLRVTEAVLSDAVGSGSAAAVGALGVRFAVEISMVACDRSEPGEVDALRCAAARAAALGGMAIGVDVDADGDVERAEEAGIGLVQGYWWGSPGSLCKLVDTWARQPISG